MTDVPPNGKPEDEDASGGLAGLPGYYPPPRPGPPPAFDDDALADALEADIASYTQPIAVVPPTTPGPPISPTPPVTPPAAALPGPPLYVEPEPDYTPPDVPEYVVPPAAPAPTYDLPAENGAGPSGPSEPSTLDAIGRLEEELRRREQGLPPADAPAAAPPAAAPPLAAPPPVAPPPPEPPAEQPAWEPALDHPAPGHVFPSPYQPFTNPVDVTPAPPVPEPTPLTEPAPPPDLPTAPPADWLAAPPPSFEPPPLVEPPAAFEPVLPPPPPPPPPTESVGPVEPTILPPVQREVRLEDVQGLPPPIGIQAAPIPPYEPYEPNAPMGPLTQPVFPPEDGDDAVDQIDQVDRVLGDDALPVTPPAGDDPFAPPSQPIATQRLREGDPALVGEKPENHPVFFVETAGADPTALDLRAGRAGRMFWLWFATNSSIISMALGAVLFTLGMSLRQAIVATLAGVALSFLPLGLGTLAGKWSGQPTMVVSRATFGHIGNVLPALVALIVRVFWGGALLWLLGTSSASLLVFAGLDVGLGETVWTYVILGIGFVLALVIAIFGYGFVARLQLVASILSGLLIAGLIYMTYPRLDLEAALATGDGAWVLVLGGTVIVFSFVGLAWVQASSDLARYQRPSSSGAATMLWATIAATLPPFILITWGAMLAASDPDLATGLAAAPLETIARMLPLWYPAPLLAAAGLGLISSVVLTLYSGGFALLALGLRMPRFAASIVAAVLVGAVAAGLLFLSADVDLIVRDVATTLAVPVAAWAGIFAAEMMIRTRQFDNAGLLAPGGVYPRFRVVNFLAFLLLTGVGYGLCTATFPGLTWQGFIWPLIGIAAEDPLATSDVGVLVALVLGIIVPLATAIPAIRRQEMESLKATPTGSIPRITGSIPRQTGSVPRVTGSNPSIPEPPPRLGP